MTRAAENLDISPAGVSAALRRLRNEFQDSLFIRKAHGVEPTVRADAIAAKLKTILELVDEARKPEGTFNPKDEERTFIVGASDYAQAIILPALLKELHRSAPGMSFAIRHTGNATVRQSLEDGTFDLVIGNVMTPLGRIRQQQLLAEGFRGLVSKSHPLANMDFDLKALNAYPALLTEAHDNYRWWEHPSFKATGYAPGKVISIPSFLGAPMLLADSQLVCVTARRLCELFIEAYPLKVIPLPFGDQTVLIRQYWHERWHTDTAHRWLRQQIHNICRTME